MKKIFNIEMTDTFCGEANYSWITRKTIVASSARGAVCIVAKDTGISWHKVWDYDGVVRYDSKSGATCMFIEEQ